MYVYAVTYTDPSEPWGVAVLDNKLYVTPTMLLDAWNDHYDAWLRDPWAKRLRELFLTWHPRYQAPYATPEHYLIERYLDEFGIARYEVVT